MTGITRQRGVAIITALLIVAIATTISISISTRLQLDVRRTGNVIAGDQAYLYLHNLIESKLHQKNQPQEIALPESPSPSAVTLLFGALTQYWLAGALETEMEEAVKDAYSRAAAHDYGLFTVLFSELLKTSASSAPDTPTDSSPNIEALHPFVDLIEPEEPWKRSLQALINISSSAEFTSEIVT